MRVARCGLRVAGLRVLKFCLLAKRCSLLDNRHAIMQFSTPDCLSFIEYRASNIEYQVLAVSLRKFTRDQLPETRSQTQGTCHSLLFTLNLFLIQALFVPLTNTTLWHEVKLRLRPHIGIYLDKLRPIHIEQRHMERNNLILTN